MLSLRHFHAYAFAAKDTPRATFRFVTTLMTCRFDYFPRQVMRDTGEHLSPRLFAAFDALSITMPWLFIAFAAFADNIATWLRRFTPAQLHFFFSSLFSPAVIFVTSGQIRKYGMSSHIPRTMSQSHVHNRYAPAILPLVFADTAAFAVIDVTACCCHCLIFHADFFQSCFLLSAAVIILLLRKHILFLFSPFSSFSADAAAMMSLLLMIFAIDYFDFRHSAMIR